MSYDLFPGKVRKFFLFLMICFKWGRILEGQRGLFLLVTFSSPNSCSLKIFSVGWNVLNLPIQLLPSNNVLPLIVCVCVGGVMLGIEPRVSHMLGKRTITEL